MTPILASQPVLRLVDGKVPSWWFGSVHVTAICRHPALPFFPHGVPAPFQQRCFAPSPAEIVAEYPIRTVIQLSGAKKKPVHRRTNPSGSFPLAGVLVWLSMYRLKSRIQLAHSMGVLVYHIEQMLVNTRLENLKDSIS